MRWKLSAGVVVALAFLIPAAPAMAQAAEPGLDKNCQVAERKIFTDIRTLVKIDVDTASADDVRVLAGQIYDRTTADELDVLPPALDKLLKVEGASPELRAFLKEGMYKAWTPDMRISIGQAMVGSGDAVTAAAQKALDAGTFDAYLAFLNDELYVARELDCKPEATPTATTPPATPTATPSATPTEVEPTPSSTSGTAVPGGDAGGLPVTGAATGTVAAVGGALLVLGAAAYLIGRRRSRFEA